MDIYSIEYVKPIITPSYWDKISSIGDKRYCQFLVSIVTRKTSTDNKKLLPVGFVQIFPFSLYRPLNTFLPTRNLPQYNHFLTVFDLPLAVQ